MRITKNNGCLGYPLIPKVCAEQMSTGKKNYVWLYWVIHFIKEKE